MRFSLRILCDCGSYATFEPKRNTLNDEEKVYEDYSSIEEGIGENEIFKASISPDTVHIQCKICGRTHELTIQEELGLSIRIREPKRTYFVIFNKAHQTYWKDSDEFVDDINEANWFGNEKTANLIIDSRAFMNCEPKEIVAKLVKKKVTAHNYTEYIEEYIVENHMK